MTGPDPDDPNDGPRHGDPHGESTEGTGGSPTDGRSSESPVARRAGVPSDVDAAFAAIVADWAAADAPHWPDTGAGRDADDGPSSGVGTATPPRGWRPAADASPGPDVTPAPREPGPPPAAHRPHPAEPPEEEFVPPDPPPLPRLGLSAIAGLLLLIVGVVLLAVPGMLGGPIGLGIVPGLLAMTAGLGWLVFGLRRSNEDDDQGPEDGAVL